MENDLFKKIFLIFFVGSTLIGCSATGPTFQVAPKPIENEALLYIYRPDSFVFGGRDASFFIDGIKVAKLSNNGYAWIHIPEGVYKLEQEWPWDVPADTLEYPLVVKKGEQIYLRFSTDVCANMGGICMQWGLDKKGNVEASEEIKQTKLQNASVFSNLSKEN